MGLRIEEVSEHKYQIHADQDGATIAGVKMPPYTMTGIYDVKNGNVDKNVSCYVAPDSYLETRGKLPTNTVIKNSMVMMAEDSQIKNSTINDATIIARDRNRINGSVITNAVVNNSDVNCSTLDGGYYRDSIMNHSRIETNRISPINSSDLNGVAIVGDKKMADAVENSDITNSTFQTDNRNRGSVTIEHSQLNNVHTFGHVEMRNTDIKLKYDKPFVDANTSLENQHVVGKHAVMINIKDGLDNGEMVGMSKDGEKNNLSPVATNNDQANINKAMNIVNGDNNPDLDVFSAKIPDTPSLAPVDDEHLNAIKEAANSESQAQKMDHDLDLSGLDQEQSESMTK